MTDGIWVTNTCNGRIRLWRRFLGRYLFIEGTVKGGFCDRLSLLMLPLGPALLLCSSSSPRDSKEKRYCQPWKFILFGRFPFVPTQTPETHPSSPTGPLSRIPMPVSLFPLILLFQFCLYPDPTSGLFHPFPIPSLGQFLILVSALMDRARLSSRRLRPRGSSRFGCGLYHSSSSGSIPFDNDAPLFSAWFPTSASRVRVGGIHHSKLRGILPGRAYNGRRSELLCCGS